MSVWVRTLLLLSVLVGASGAAWSQSHAQGFTELVDANHRSVVNISTTRRQTSLQDALPPGLEIPDLENSPWGDWLKRFLEQMPQQDQGAPAPEADSLGSGFVISEDGYVLTNNHVIEDAEEIFVRFHDRRQLSAKLIGRDERSDVALLKVEAQGLPTVTIGESQSLRVGEWVLAIGSPFGFDFSVTSGIVSAKGRTLPNERYVPFIQTDVAINPGNSGGPLFNMDGEVVGINSQIYSRTGGFMGLSFAIPIEMAMDVAEQLKNKGKVSRGWLGVLIQEVTKDLAESFKMERAYGALVSRILPDSPASKSNLKVGDVIVAFNGERVETSSALPALVGRAPVGKPSSVKVVRAGRNKTIKVVIGELPSDEELGQRNQGFSKRHDESNKLGLQVTALDKEQRQALGLQDGKGVLVSNLKADGVAAEGGIQKGDVITMINNKAVDSVADFRRITSALKAGDSVAVLVHRESGPLFLALKLADE